MNVLASKYIWHALLIVSLWESIIVSVCGFLSLWKYACMFINLSCFYSFRGPHGTLVYTKCALPSINKLDYYYYYVAKLIRPYTLFLWQNFLFLLHLLTENCLQVVHNARPLRFCLPLCKLYHVFIPSQVTCDCDPHHNHSKNSLQQYRAEQSSDIWSF